MKLLIMATLIMTMATSALAFFDPTPDTIGIYLDTEANEVCVEGLVDGDTGFTFYMIITNPSFSTMDGFLAGYHFEGVAGLNSFTLAHVNGSDSGYLGEHLVNYDSPVPMSANTLLMTISATYYDYEYGSALLKLHGIPLAKNTNVPSVMLGGGSQNLNVSYDDGVTVRINAGCGPVANENMSFDEVKSLYR